MGKLIKLLTPSCCKSKEKKRQRSSIEDILVEPDTARSQLTTISTDTDTLRATKENLEVAFNLLQDSYKRMMEAVNKQIEMAKEVIMASNEDENNTLPENVKNRSALSKENSQLTEMVRLRTECSKIMRNALAEQGEALATQLQLIEMNPISIIAVEESFHEIPDDKSYLCSVCGKFLHSFSGLRRHNMNHQDKKKWECQICHKTFVEKDHFTGHISVHHKIGQFACKKCHKEYAYKASFTRHMKVCKKADNTNIQEYKCDICSSTFNKKDILNDHVKGKHGCSTGHYPCSVCGKRFRYRTSRSKHTKSVHK